jgi:hypothetical protein
MTRWPAPATTRSCSCFVLGDAGRCSALRGARPPGAPRLARGLSDLASVGRARPACYDVGRARRSVADVRLGLGLVVVAAGPGSYDEFAGAGDRAAGRAEPGGIDVGAALGVGEHPAPSGRGPRLASDPREHAPTRPGQRRASDPRALLRSRQQACATAPQALNPALLLDRRAGRQPSALLRAIDVAGPAMPQLRRHRIRRVAVKVVPRPV